MRRRTGIGPDTRTLYVRHIERLTQWLTPIVGQSPTVKSLTRDHVRDLVNARERGGAAPKTIRNHHGLLFSLMGTRSNGSFGRATLVEAPDFQSLLTSTTTSR